jgi:hypothetical protein
MALQPIQNLLGLHFPNENGPENSAWGDHVPLDVSSIQNALLFTEVAWFQLSGLAETLRVIMREKDVEISVLTKLHLNYFIQSVRMAHSMVVDLGQSLIENFECFFTADNEIGVLILDAYDLVTLMEHLDLLGLLLWF